MESANLLLYGAKIQYAKALVDTSPCLSAKETTHIQQVISTFLYYGIAVDPTMLVAIGSIPPPKQNPRKPRSTPSSTS
jgi:hypothetical protein